MPTSATPQWAAQHAGVLGQADAMAGAASVNQLLGTHPGNQVYQGTQILTPNGTGGAFSVLPLNQYDKAQPFTMSGTSIGRVNVPFAAFGTGADLIVSLCNDNGGSPGTVITRTRIPANWFQYLPKYTALAGTSPVLLQATGSPLAAPAFNAFTMGAVEPFNFTGGTPSGGGFGTTGPAVVSNGADTIVIMGGLNAADNYVTNVFSITYQGTNALANMIAQPSLPTGLGSYAACTITTDPTSGDQYVIATGGATGNSGAYTTVATVYASQLTGATGQMSAWSTQASLPQPMQTASAAASGNIVYVIGGVTPSNTLLGTVYWANVSNGQLQTWNTGPALPVALYDANVAAVNGFLIVAGGYTATGLTSPTTAVWYAPINTDGSLGAWQPGPPLPAVNANTAGGFWAAGSDGILFRGGSTAGFYSLPVSTLGPAVAWQRQSFPGAGSPGALLPNGPGQYFWFEGFASGGTSYNSAGFILCPYLSVPLPATGLTNGGTYHLMFQQPAGAVDLSNYLSNTYDSSVFPGNPTQRYRPRGSSTWTADTVAIPVTIYDNSNGSPAANGATGNTVVWHTWEDGGARITTLVRATTPDQRLIGILEATASPAAMNSNPGFQAGVSPWTGVNGTIAQSAAQSYEGGFSLLLTPAGGFASAYAASELIACVPGVSYTVTGWCYSPGGYGAVGLNLAFFNASSGSTGSSSSSVAVPAGVWTPLTTTFTAPTASTVTLQIQAGESGTPTAGNTVYFDQVMVYETYGGPQVSTVAQIEYTGTWPPTGVTVLA